MPEAPSRGERPSVPSFWLSTFDLMPRALLPGDTDVQATLADRHRPQRSAVRPAHDAATHSPNLSF
jgi:hypothetical protein